MIEQTREKFELQTYLNAQSLCRDVVAQIGQRVERGMSERDGQQLVKELFKKAGVVKFWHPTKFRIGADTLKNFSEPTDRSISLEPGEIFYIDVGPIIGDHEADYGRTFVLEADAKRDQFSIAMGEASEKIWRQVARAWKVDRLTGKALLDRAAALTDELGYRFNPKMAGHRLADFPHALFSKKKLFALDIVPAPNLWVLEIHIFNRQQDRGAFFEDILL